MRAELGFDLYKGFLVAHGVAGATSLTYKYFSRLTIFRIFSSKTQSDVIFFGQRVKYWIWTDVLTMKTMG